MSQAPSVAVTGIEEDSLARAAGSQPEVPPAPRAVSLRGTTRGLEIVISGTPSTVELGAQLTALLDEAPGFFAGSQARVAVDGSLPSGALACLEEIAARFALQIVEIGPATPRRKRADVPRVLRPEDVPMADLAEGTGPIPDDATLPLFPLDALLSLPASAASAAPSAAPTPGARDAAAPKAVAPSAAAVSGATGVDVDLAEAIPPGPRLVIGPVRSGMIVDHAGHLIVIGDVNPGAEIRAEGSIIVFGRLRGVAHAAIGTGRGFIVALTLQPQQLRIGRMIARAAESDRPSDGAEIAYASGETIVVERFLGRLPSGLAASM